MAEPEIQSNLKQNTATAHKPSSYLHVRFESYQLASVPDLGGFYHNEFRRRIEEIQSHTSNLLGNATKAFRKIFTQPKEAQKEGSLSRKNGFEIAQYQQNPKNLKLVEQLEQSPEVTAARVALASHILQAQAPLDVDGLRRLMMQTAIPIGLGVYNAENIKMLLTVHRMYQSKLLELYRRDIETVRGYIENTREDRQDLAHKVTLEKLLVNEAILTRFMQRSGDPGLAESDLKSLNIANVNKVIEGKMQLPPGATLADFKRNTERNLAAILLCLNEVEFLHPELLQITETMLAMVPNSAIPYFLQGRLWMQQLRRAVAQHEVTQKEKLQLQDCLKKCLTAYGHGLKALPQQSNTPLNDLQRQVYLGHATACLFAYSLRSLIGIPNAVVQKFLVTGYKSLEHSKLQVTHDKARLYERYLQALTEQGLHEVAHPGSALASSK